MFKLVIMMFVVTNGVQAEKPAATAMRKEPFATMEGCKKHLSSKAGAEDKKNLEALVKSQKGNLAIGITCVKAKIEDDQV